MELGTTRNPKYFQGHVKGNSSPGATRKCQNKRRGPWIFRTAAVLKFPRTQNLAFWVHTQGLGGAEDPRIDVFHEHARGNFWRAEGNYAIT